MGNKKFYRGLELMQPNVIEPTKMPRTAAIPVVRDPESGYLNAGTYSCGVVNTSPLQIIFGPKGADAIAAFRAADEFTVAVPRCDQLDAMWTTALEVPHGINEIEIAGWHELPSQKIATPGIAECPLNLECKKIFLAPLPRPWRTIVVAEVVGVSIDSRLLSMSRSETVKLFPLHEAGSHPQTGLYSPSHLSGELIPAAHPELNLISDYGLRKEEKTFIPVEKIYQPENARVLMNAIWPRPGYILLTADSLGKTCALPLIGGSLQSTEPAVQIPVPRASPSYTHIRNSGVFSISIPDRSLISQFESLLSSPNHDLVEAGFHLLPANEVGIGGVAECPVTMDCKVVFFEDVPGTDYAFVVGRRVGVSLDEQISEALDSHRHFLAERLAYVNHLYAQYLYSVLDISPTGKLQPKWGFHDPEMLSVRSLPSWGSRYTGGWWGPGPALNFWLIELSQSGLISKPEFYKITYALRLWNNGRLIPHLAEYITPAMKEELRVQMTQLFHKMAWAHRDLEKWQEVHSVLEKFPEEPRSHHDGPIYHEKWYDSHI